MPQMHPAGCARVFVSPNVPGVEKRNNERVFEDYMRFEAGLAE